jgi:hypothetical protein
MIERGLVWHAKNFGANFPCVDAQHVERRRAASGPGEHFVVPTGGAIEWNHPNDERLLRIPNHLVRTRFDGLDAGSREKQGRP